MVHNSHRSLSNEANVGRYDAFEVLDSSIVWRCSPLRYSRDPLCSTQARAMLTLRKFRLCSNLIFFEVSELQGSCSLLAVPGIS
jgi:hypothetical protein